MNNLEPILQFVMAAQGWQYPATVDALARRLPPIPTAGLELPLGDPGPIDLQQRIRGPEETRRLSRWLARLPQLSTPWQMLRDAVSEVESEVEELWLELDAGADDPPLSVFARLPQTSQHAAALPVKHILEAFRMPVSASRAAALDLCLSACIGSVHVSHLGLMLGRPGAPLRLIMDGIAPEDVATFLAYVGWPGARERAMEWSDRLFLHSDRIRFAFTLDDGLSPDLGLECFVGAPENADPRWRCLLDNLVDLGVCATEQQRRLLSWPATLTPSSIGKWPDALLMDALLRGLQEVRWLQCRLSHVKVTLRHGQAPSAKGYVGFLEVHDGALVSHKPQPRAPSSGLADAIDGAMSFLLGARTQAGWWLDYDGFTEGPAEEWVTAYVAHALSACSPPAAAQASRRAWYLLARRARQGWGWNGLQPPDADSTIWSLRLAASLGHLESTVAQEAAAFLRRHVTNNGGICTYLHQAHRNTADEIEINPGWYEPHACVTAAAAHIPGFGGGSQNFLRQSQRVDGTWHGYWWKSDAYTTALAAEALAGEVGDTPRVTRAIAAAHAALEASRQVPMSPFETALALRTLLLEPRACANLVKQARDTLLADQLMDGSWPASAELSIPNHRGEIVPALDSRRCLTTATVLTTLAALALKAREA